MLVRDPQLLAISVFDPASIDPLQKAIRESPLGLNPRAEGQEVLVPIPRCAALRCAVRAGRAGTRRERAGVGPGAVGPRGGLRGVRGRGAERLGGRAGRQLSGQLLGRSAAGAQAGGSGAGLGPAAPPHPRHRTRRVLRCAVACCGAGPPRRRCRR